MAAEKPLVSVTCTAPTNIAVIKYWGKRDEKLILPINSSLSVTLHQNQLKTTTTAAISRDFKEDRIWLNGKEEDVGHHRLQSCLREIRRLARKRRSGSDGDLVPLSYKVHIASVNDFPTAAGLASSAAGYACLVYTLAQLYGVESELSEVARQGSGSACRSMFGGFVQWHMGERPDGKDSIAQQVAPESHWPELRVLVLVVSAERKPVSSTSGMQTSVETSSLLKTSGHTPILLPSVLALDSWIISENWLIALQFRAESVVPGRMAEMARCIKERDFEAFGQLTMKDSNQFHATCLDTFPPICYLNDTSRQIISLVHCFNAYYGKTKVAYTFDAGPNAVIFTLEETVDEFVAVIKQVFPPEMNGDKFLKGLPVEPVELSEEVKSALPMEPFPGGIRYIITTQVGPGPQVLEEPQRQLLGPDGLPKPVS
ncbi:diphosphomevalonate decarboxylase isoform X1 [Monodelphis domestica]|uniref:diphosphomevalonate decarboxylase isoform X1 n=1 Tax=Monodelphis domestica TaxID=13616 RepID=UPI0024E1BE7D|nr:diphosphomevalonate decarboxylase isoform X1 [Monodelphis domestica]